MNEEIVDMEIDVIFENDEAYEDMEQNIAFMFKKYWVTEIFKISK